MRLRWKLAAGLLAIVILIPIGSAYGLYFWGLSLVPQLPDAPAADGFSPVLRDAFWAELENSTPVVVEPVTPVQFLVRFARLRLASVPDPATYGSGLRIPGLCARQIVEEGEVGSPPSFERHLATAAVSLWLTSNWSTEEIIACAMRNMYFGHGLQGLEPAAEDYFGKAVSEISHGEAATLAVVSRAPSRFDPVCNANLVLERRDRLLTRLSDLALITAKQEANSKTSPLGIVLSADCN